VLLPAAQSKLPMVLLPAEQWLPWTALRSAARIPALLAADWCPLPVPRGSTSYSRCHGLFCRSGHWPARRHRISDVAICVQHSHSGSWYTSTLLLLVLL
jgi:hypothetical protein